MTVPDFKKLLKVSTLCSRAYIDQECDLNSISDENIDKLNIISDASE